MKKQVIKHLKSDIKNFKKEASDDKKLIKKLVKPKKKHDKKPEKKPEKKGHEKFEKVMKEFKEGKLHSGSKKGPKVKKLKQARAIGYSEDRRADGTAKGGK